MTFDCLACGGKFENRLDHMDDCPGPFPASWWSEDDGDVLWWCWRDGDWLGEAPYVGSPLDLGQTVRVSGTTHSNSKSLQMDVGGWPAYHTHWTRLPKLPNRPKTWD